MLRKTFSASLFGSFAILFAACGTTEGQAPEQGDTLHVFQINALTGQSAAFGTAAVRGATVAAEQINQQGGFTDDCDNEYEIKLSKWDMADSPEQAIGGLRKADNDSSVVAVIGATPSTGFLPMVPVAGQLQLPLISPGSGAPIEEWNPYAFRVTVTSETGEPAQLRLLDDKFGLERVAVIYDQTQDNEKNGAQLTELHADEIGYDIVAFEAFKEGDTDFRPQLTKIKNSNPDWVGVFAATNEMGKIVNQMHQLQIWDDVQVFSHAGIPNDPAVWDVTNGGIKGALNWTAAVDLSSKDAEIQEFARDYTNSFSGEDPTLYSVYGYQSLHAVVDAATRACTVTDREELRDALGDTEIDALGSSVIFDSPPDNANGENLGAVEAVQVTRVTGRGSFEVIEE